MINRSKIRYVLASLLGSLVIAGIIPDTASGIDAPQLKAVYTLNFAKFAHWPPGASDASDVSNDLNICYTDQASVATSMPSLSGKKIGNRNLHLRQMTLPGNVSGCHVFFIHDNQPQKLYRYLNTLNSLPILTIGDSSGFAKNGGMVELFEQNRKIRFRINLEALRNSELRLDSQILDLAVEVLK